MGSRYKIPNFQKADSLTNSSAPHSSGIYFGKVVSIEDEYGLNEGQIKVNIPSFDLGNKPFCKDLEPKSLQTSSVKLKRKQGNNLNTNFNASSDITNQTKINSLTKRKLTTQVPELTEIGREHV